MIYLPYVAFILIVIITKFRESIIFLKRVNIEKSINSFSDKKIFIVLVLSTILTQFWTTNQETIDWDINTFIIMGQDLLRGNLPYIQQYEFKGPILSLIYSIPVFFNKLYVVKLFNDLTLSVLVCQIYSISKKINVDKPNLKNVLSALYFLLYMSYSQAHPGMSEIYGLLFISLAINTLVKPINSKLDIFKSGAYMSCAFLVTSSVVLFVITIFLFFIYKLFLSKELIKITNLIYGGLILPLVFIGIYAFNDSLYDLVFTLLIYPLIYTGGSLGSNMPEEFIKYIIEYIYMENYFSLGLISIFVFFIFVVTTPKVIYRLFRFENTSFNKQLFYSLTLASVCSFLIVNSPHWHYMIYYFFFSSFILNFINYEKIKIPIYSLILICVLNIFPFMIRDSYKIIVDFENIEKAYPIYQDYKYINENYKISSILPLDNHLILFYFNLPSEAKLIHPSNHFKPYIDLLIQKGLIPADELQNLILDGTPDLLVCKETLEVCKNLDQYQQLSELNSNVIYFINKRLLD